MWILVTYSHTVYSHKILEAGSRRVCLSVCLSLSLSHHTHTHTHAGTGARAHTHVSPSVLQISKYISWNKTMMMWWYPANFEWWQTFSSLVLLSFVQNISGSWAWYYRPSNQPHVGERGGEWGKQVGSMNEESQVRGCYWAIQRSWFARVNALCNLSRKKSRDKNPVVVSCKAGTIMKCSGYFGEPASHIL